MAHPVSRTPTISARTTVRVLYPLMLIILSSFLRESDHAQSRQRTASRQQEYAHQFASDRNYGIHASHSGPRPSELPSQRERDKTSRLGKRHSHHRPARRTASRTAATSQARQRARDSKTREPKRTCDSMGSFYPRSSFRYISW